MADISFMGVGSGILNQDMLDAYKKDFEAVALKPLTQSMQKNLDKQKSLTELMTLVETLKTATKKFNDLDTYMQRTSSVTGEGVSATIGMGTALQDIKISVHQLAKGDVTQLGKKFESRDSVFSTTNTKLEFNHNGKDYSINIRAGQTVGDVAQAITDATDGAVMGIVMKTGGSQPYQLMIQSKETGESNRVYFGNTVSSGAVKGGAIKGEFALELGGKTLNVKLDTSNSSSSQDNIAAIKTAIEKAIEDSGDDDLKKDYADGKINVGIVNDGKGFVINDRSGGTIKISSSTLNLKDIGFSGATGGGNALETTTSIGADQLSGKININGTEIDLAAITKAGNKKEDNQKAIADAINKIGGVKAEFKGDTLILNDTSGTGKGVTYGDLSAIGSNLTQGGTATNPAQSLEFGASTNAFQGRSPVAGGGFTGKLKIGDVELDLSALTKAGNTGEENLKAIVDHINNNSKEVDASMQDGKLVVNAKASNPNKNVQIIFDEKNSADQNKDIIGKLGIVNGNHASSQSFLDDIGITTIQKAQDAKFSWNGIEISRSTNTVNDVVSGISVELTKEHKPGDSAVIRISRDDEKVFEDIDKFVEAYNELMTKVDELTRFDEQTKIAGIFNGDSSIRGIKSSLKSILNFSAGVGENVSMATYGFTINDDGKLILDKDKLKQKYKDNPEMALSFFKGGEVLVGGVEIPKKRPDGSIIDGEFERIGGKPVMIKGFFTQFAETIDTFITGPNSILKSYEQSLKTEYKKDEEQKKFQEERVNARVSGLKQRFNAYDGMIAKMNNQMQQLQQIMNASMAK